MTPLEELFEDDIPTNACSVEDAARVDVEDCAISSKSERDLNREDRLNTELPLLLLMVLLWLLLLLLLLLLMWVP